MTFHEIRERTRSFIRTSASLAGSCVLLAAHAGFAGAQAASAREVARDSSARMERLADGVYAIIHDDATEDWPHGNTGVVVGSDGVLVIDSNYLPVRAAMDIALIRKMTPLPVRYLVNTHWHGDHTHGNGVYRDSFPGIAIVSARDNYRFIELNLVKLPKGFTLPSSFQRAAIAQLEARLAAGKDSAGHAFTADERARLTRNLAQRRVELSELAKVKVAPPTTLFDRSLTIALGSRRVELVNRGPANSPADVTIYLPAERILFTGDILVHPLPYAIGAWPKPWIGVLRELEAIPVTALVPGHGPVMADHSYTRLVRELLETTETRVDELFRRGLNTRQVVDSLRLDDLRSRFAQADGTPVPAQDWRAWSRSVVDQMAQCVQGYRC
jgi:glyoxylase-like metal-dependent hydrolase (beta-lactamase superfamily II)